MRRYSEKGKQVELASIAGLVAIFVFAELNFSVFEHIAATLTQSYPFLADYSFALVIGGWIGLSVYTLRRRREAGLETRARIAVEEDFELNQIRDSVTGLPNKRGFELVLGERIQHPGSDTLHLIGCEVRNIDTILSVHGARAAEDIKSSFANALVSLCELGDFAACSNDATFYVIAAAPNDDEGKFKVDSLVETLSSLASAGIPANGMKLQSSMTFGLLNVGEYLRLKPDTTVEALMQRLEFTLSTARRQKHGTIAHFSAEMESSLDQRAKVEASFGQAILNGEIVPYFQPFIDLATKRVCGLEILARWEHPQNGLIGPTTFIPIAEDIGLLRTMTLSILRQACISAREWPDDIKLAINVSPTDLRDNLLTDEIINTLKQTGMAPERIELEITENAIVEESGAISEAISRVKALGMSISIDDFGTGYSSLHHLRILPFDKIKIDQSFIKDISTNPESRAIVQTVIALGKSLGLPTTAEGVDAAQNQELLAELGCTIGQGYLFAKPLPAHEVTTFLKNYENLAVGLSQVA